MTWLLAALLCTFSPSFALERRGQAMTCEYRDNLTEYIVCWPTSMTGLDPMIPPVVFMRPRPEVKE